MIATAEPGPQAARRAIVPARACASCHLFGDNDDLAWDLGNPDDVARKNPITFTCVPPGQGARLAAAQ